MDSERSHKRSGTGMPQRVQPNMRLKLAALLLKEALCCRMFGMSAAA